MRVLFRRQQSSEIHKYWPSQFTSISLCIASRGFQEVTSLFINPHGYAICGLGSRIGGLPTLIRKDQSSVMLPCREFSISRSNKFTRESTAALLMHSVLPSQHPTQEGEAVRSGNSNNEAPPDSKVRVGSVVTTECTSPVVMLNLAPIRCGSTLYGSGAMEIS